MRVFLCNSWNLKKLLHTVFPKFMNHNKNNTRFINWDTFNLSMVIYGYRNGNFQILSAKDNKCFLPFLNLAYQNNVYIDILRATLPFVSSHSTGSWLKSSIKDKGAKFDVLYSWKMIFIFVIKFWNRKEKKKAIKLVLNTFGSKQSSHIGLWLQ